ncbi:type III restriction endonuclease subunit R, partial [Yersinia sp. 2542 StPb PI]
ESNIKIKDVLYNDVFCDFEDLGGSENYVTAKRVVNVGGDLVASIANAFEVVIDNDLFVMNGNYFTDSEKEQLNVLAWKNLEKYYECDLSFMAADFTNTLIYKAHPQLFKEVTLPNLRTRSVPIDERLKVYYFSKNHKFSDN